MSRETRSIRKNNRGFTIVELLCALAIFSCIMAIIGGVLVVTARTFRSGTAETSLQEEAQVTINVIENLIVDATESVNYYYDNAGTWVAVSSEAAAITAGAAGTDRRLQIVNGLTESYDIYYSASAHTLKYQKTEGAEVSTQYDVAGNVTDFGVDISNFGSTHSVILSLGLEQDGRQYSATYNVTSRNDNVTANTYTPSDWASITLPEGTIIVEAGQSILIDVTVTGHYADGGDINCIYYLQDFSDTTSSVGLEPGTISTLRLSAGVNEQKGEDGQLFLVVKTDRNAPNGNPIASVTIPVFVRRIESMTMPYSYNHGLDEHAAGQKYTLTSGLSGLNLSKLYSNKYDDPTLDPAIDPAYEYKNPYRVEWTFEGTDASGNAITNIDDYITVNEKDENTDVNASAKCEFTLDQDLPNGYKIRVTCRALHPRGEVSGTKYNKSGNPYGDIYQSMTIVSDGVAYDWATVSVPDVMVIEPGQSITLNNVIDGAYADGTSFTWDYTLSGAGDDDTGVTPNVDAKSLVIKAGAAEHGDVDGKMTLTVYANDTHGSLLASDDITIYVRRVESMALNGHDTDDTLDAHAAGQIYSLEASLAGIHLAKLDGNPYDEGAYAYVDPYSVAWAFEVTDASGVPVVYSDYITDITGDTNTGGATANCQFKLSQDLPVGYTIKAICTAMHTAGTNKSLLAYDPIVKMTYPITSDGVPVVVPEEPEIPSYTVNGSLFKRGTEYTFPGDEYLSITMTDCDDTKKNEITSASEAKYFWRYREINADGSKGAWSTFRRTVENSPTQKINNVETLALRPDKAYELEFVFAYVNTSTRKVYYPFSDSLLAEAGFETLTKAWGSETETPAANYSKRYIVGATQLKFEVGTDGSGNKLYAFGLGSQDLPLHIYSGTAVSYPMEADYMHYGNTQAAYTLVVQEKSGSDWVTSSKTYNNDFKMQIGSQSFMFSQNTPTDITGDYRFAYVANGYVMKELTSTDILNPTYGSVAAQDFNLYTYTADTADVESGVIYAKFN